jgi:hypothetical protein
MRLSGFQRRRDCQVNTHQPTAPDQTPAIASQSPSVRNATPNAVKKAAVEMLVAKGGFCSRDLIDGMRAAAMKKLPAAISKSCQLNVGS